MDIFIIVDKYEIQNKLIEKNIYVAYTFFLIIHDYYSLQIIIQIKKDNVNQNKFVHYLMCNFLNTNFVKLIPWFSMTKNVQFK